MNNFDVFYETLKNARDKNISLKIKGAEKQVKAMVRLTTIHYIPAQDEYIKIIFTDGCFLFTLKNDKEIYYSDSIIGHVKEISDELIGKETLQYNGKTYDLVNRDDCQFVLEVISGSPLDIEGEAYFSDYFPADGTKEFLSLGWLSRTRARADINPVLIPHDDVELVNED